MRQSRANTGGDRSNALWGRGSRGETRSNALWGRGGRRAGVVVAALTAAFAMAAAASAGNGAPGGNLKAFVDPSLQSAIQQSPDGTYDVIVMGDKKGKSAGLYKQLVGASADASAVKKQFNSVDAVEATLTGSQITTLANKP